MQEKDLVQQRFSRQYDTYDSVAIVQRQMAVELIDALLRFNNFACPSVFEVGCGTGLVTRLLCENLKMKQFLASDIIPEGRKTVDHIFKHVDFPFNFEQSNINTYAGIDFSADIVASGACLQWCDDLPSFVKKISKDISNEGLFAFSTFGPNNFNEITSISGSSLEYKSTEELKDILHPYFEIEFLETFEKQMLFDSPIAVLEHIKQTGVNALQRTRWTKSKLHSFTAEYSDQFQIGEQVRLTYEPIIVIARKKLKCINPT